MEVERDANGIIYMVEKYGENHGSTTGDDYMGIRGHTCSTEHGRYKSEAEAYIQQCVAWNFLEEIGCTTASCG